MLIHTVKDGDDLFSIARKYSTYPQKLLSDNYPLDERLTEGDEILVIIPTKTTCARGGDTLASIARRNGMKENCLLRQNNELIRGSLKPGQTITIKQSPPTLGAATAIGKYSPAFPISNLNEALPYLTYVATDGLVITESGVNIIRGIEKPLRECIEKGKIPLITVSDQTGGEGLVSAAQRSDIICKLIEISKSYGFKGIVIRAKEFSEKYGEKYLDFLLELRKNFLGYDLILFSELFESTPTDSAEISDGAILNTGIKDIGSLKNDLRSVAQKTESSKIFVCLYTDVQVKERAVTFKEARRLGSGRFSSVSTDKNSLISSLSIPKIENGKRGVDTVSFPSLKYTKAKIEELSELGFMGISINLRCLDVTRLCMFNAAFRRADYELP